VQQAEQAEASRLNEEVPQLLVGMSYRVALEGTFSSLQPRDGSPEQA
jgi:hypothetical protein